MQPSKLFELPAIESAEEHLLNLLNMDEVAYCTINEANSAPQGYPVGVHYALRDVY